MSKADDWARAQVEVRARFADAEAVPPMNGEWEPDDPYPDVQPAPNGPSGPDEPNDAELAKRLAFTVGLPLNDYGNGQRLRTHFGADMMFVPRIGWFVWTGEVWHPDEDGILTRRNAHKIAPLIIRETDLIEPTRAEREVLESLDEAEGEIATIEALSSPSADERARLKDAKRIRADVAHILDKLETLRGQRRRHAKNAGNSGPVTNMIAEAGPYLNAPVDGLNAEPLAINTATGTLRLVQVPDVHAPPDVPDAELPRVYQVVQHPHVRGDLITKMMPVEYDPGATCPIWERTIRRIQPNREMREFLQRWFGYSLTGLTNEQKLCFFYGVGRNGKSTVVDLIARMMGEYATSIPIETLTGQESRKGAEATPDLVRLPGARMVRASEPEEGVRFKEAMIKLMTGGEPIMIRRMREEFVEVEPIFKLTISGNHKPNVRGTDDGIWRRLLLVPFTEQIPKDEVDPMLPAKLWQERSGILNWLIEGALDYLNGGLREPDEVLSATAEFREESDPVRKFLDDACLVDGSSEFTRSKFLIEAFQWWQTEEGMNSWATRTVGIRFKQKAGAYRSPVSGATFTKHKSDGNSGYTGVTLLPGFIARWEGVARKNGPKSREDREDDG